MPSVPNVFDLSGNLTIYANGGLWERNVWILIVCVCVCERERERDTQQLSLGTMNSMLFCVN